MKHRFSFVLTLWWVLILGMLAVLMLIFAPKNERVSDIDNRMLAGVPELTKETFLSAEFMQGVDSWLSDSFFAREEIVSLTKGLLASTAFERYEKDIEAELAKEQEEAEKKLLAQEESEQNLDSDVNTQDVAPSEESDAISQTDQAGQPGENVLTDDSEEIPAEEIPAEEIPDDAADEEAPKEVIRGSAYLWMEMTDGTRENLYTFSEKNINTVAKMLDAYRDALGEDGTVHYMQIPYSTTAYRWLNNTHKYCGWGSNVEDALRSRVKSGVYIHNIAEIFEEPLKNGEYLYYRSDHHWSPRGAALACSAIMASQGYPTVDFDDYNYLVHNKFYGSLFDASAPEKVKSDTLEIWYPNLPERHFLVQRLTRLEEHALMDYERKNYRAYLFGTLGPWRLIDTGYSTGRNALIISDSYGTAFAPFLLPYYDTVLMTDLRPDYYNKTLAGASVREYIKQYDIDDVYMVLSTNSGVHKKYSLSYMMKYLD
ncbi:MAG: hypothetical protein IKJ65_11435 [Clostridia bacterium]|nr:hypothetical protein [Clostridia bacterium]